MRKLIERSRIAVRDDVRGVIERSRIADDGAAVQDDVYSVPAEYPSSRTAIRDLLILSAGLLLCILATTNLFALELTGYASYEQRVFFDDPQFDSQHRGDAPNLVLEPELYHVSADGNHTITFRPFFRYDPDDPERTHGDIRQLDWLYSTGDWEISLGVSKVFWGVTESRHLVDILNQTDAVESPDGEDKLGQPMIRSSWYRDWGTIHAYLMPYFREQTFGGREGRLRAGKVVDTDNPEFTNSAEEWHTDFALRYEHSFGYWDLGLAHFYGTSREPILREQGNEFIPVYEIIHQTSLDAQYTVDAWLWKLESIVRQGHGRTFAAASGGFEYTFYGIFETAQDLGILMEYHWDDRSNQAPGVSFDRDLFVGFRWILNNISGAEVLLGSSFDLQGDGSSLFIEGLTRLSQHWTLEVETRFNLDLNEDSPFAHLDNEDFAQVRLAYYF